MQMSRIDLKKSKKIYFIGIGGIGMSAIARMFLAEGKAVSGSDLSASEVTDELKKLGAEIKIGAPVVASPFVSELPAGIDLVIYTVAIPDNHPELVFARNGGIPTISYPESLGLISKDKFTIAIAGTHGKTTTTGMIAQILIKAGLAPTVIVGSFLRSQESNFIAGGSKYFVVEACEYKRSFLNLRPDIAVITNIDDDHLDYYKNLAGVQDGFRDFLGRVKGGGTVVTDVNNEKIRPILPSILSVSGRPALKTAGRKANFKIVDYKTVDEKITLKIPGVHNIQNAKAALAVALALDIPKEKAIRALEDFSGTRRRFEEKGITESGAMVYDDYAHHPTEINATMQAAREKFPKQKIIVAFQPHLYSRTKEHFDEFGPALSLADEIILLPIYAAREPNDETVSSRALAEKLVASGLKAVFFESFESAAGFLKEHLADGEILFTMGAGDINKLGEMTLRRTANVFGGTTDNK